MPLALLLSPLARGAYFDGTEDIALRELEVLGFEPGAFYSHGDLRFLNLEATQDDLRALLRASWVQGAFEIGSDGRLLPLDQTAEFLFPSALVYGQKYQGKTHELVTQLALNVALASLKTTTASPVVFDPMAGRGTTLLWALRYGLSGRGVELDGKAVELFHNHVKKQCKLQRISHEALRGRIGKEKRTGMTSRFVFGSQKLLMVTGDSGNVLWQEGQKFDLVVSDLPYGIQHPGRDRRNPLSVVEEVAGAWVTGLRPGGVVALLFNDLQTQRASLQTLFEGFGLEALPHAFRHRMSESIVRDLLVLRLPGGLAD